MMKELEIKSSYNQVHQGSDNNSELRTLNCYRPALIRSVIGLLAVA